MHQQHPRLLAVNPAEDLNIGSSGLTVDLTQRKSAETPDALTHTFASTPPLEKVRRSSVHVWKQLEFPLQYVGDLMAIVSWVGSPPPPTPPPDPESIISKDNGWIEIYNTDHLQLFSNIMFL